MELPTDVLRTFVAASDAKSYTEAAAMIHRSQSAVSMQMKKLEGLVGQSLFSRNGRYMELTAEGQTLLWYARRILKLHDEAVSAMLRPEISGRVRIGAPDDYAERLLPLLLSRFAATHPHVQVEVVCQANKDMLGMLDTEQLDLLVYTNREVPKRGVTICHDQLVWVASAKHVVHEQDPLPLALYNCDCIYRQWALKSMDGISRNYRIAYSSPSFTGILAAVRSGLAVTAAGKSTVPDDLRILGASDGFPDLPSVVITLITAATPLSQAAEVLADYVSDSFRELIAA